MKTYSHLYFKLSEFDTLLAAYKRAASGKRYQPEVLRFNHNLESELLRLQQELREQSYRHGGYREFIVHEAKKRHIRAAPFRDRVVHQAVCAALEPVFERSFIAHSYACRTGKGTQAAVDELQAWLRRLEDGPETPLYVLRCDISRYFASIDQATLLRLLKRRLRDPRLVWLLEQIVYSYREAPDSGIPIGNLTSQLFANIYLDQLDQFVKHDLRRRYYMRYMDDFLLLGHDKPALKRCRRELEGFLSSVLGLELHPDKAYIMPVGRGIEWLGYQVFARHMRLRSSSVRRFTKRTCYQQRQIAADQLDVDTLRRSLTSWNAYAKYGDSWLLRRSLERDLDINLIQT